MPGSHVSNTSHFLIPKAYSRPSIFASMAIALRGKCSPRLHSAYPEYSDWSLRHPTNIRGGTCDGTTTNDIKQILNSSPEVPIHEYKAAICTFSPSVCLSPLSIHVFHALQQFKIMSFALPKLFIDLQVPLLYATNIFALALGPSNRVLQLSLTLPIFTLLVTQSLYREWSGTWGIHYAVECMVLSVVWQYVDWILLQSPDKEAWRKINYQNGGGEKEKAPQGFWQRVWWGVRLASGNRYVGWSQEVKNVPREVGPEYSRV
jgi:hypothetical protein